MSTIPAQRSAFLLALALAACSNASAQREPARPVRATNVADVHVLAQDMVHHSERRRLLVFCDNRQDAAATIELATDAAGSP